MTELSEGTKPYGVRDQIRFASEMAKLTQHHIRGCPAYLKISAGWQANESVESLPFVHVGLFKRVLLRTDTNGIKHGRLLNSSSTSGAGASQIVLDQHSSALQQTSVRLILSDFIGNVTAPLLLLDRVSSLRQREVSARVAAGLSLQPLSNSMHFILNHQSDSVNWGATEKLLNSADELIVYGFTWILWKAWAQADVPDHLEEVLRRKRIYFVHSGGWKRVQAEKITMDQFNSRILARVAAGSRVIDFYGLVEQVGVIYPMCEYGYRHVPVWADALVRDPLTHQILNDSPGQLQLMNTLAWGAPYHNVLTEDLAEVVTGKCACGRPGKRFVLLGRMPNVELRGCANV